MHSETETVPAKTPAQDITSYDSEAESIDQILRKHTQALTVLFEQSKAIEAHTQAITVLFEQSKAIEAHTQALTALFEQSKAIEALSQALASHSQAIQSLGQSYQNLATQFEFIPHLYSLIQGLQIELESGFTFRPNSLDRQIFQAINYPNYNEYRLPEKFEADDIIVDVGSHIGSFAYACLLRQAGMVYCFEPYTENYARLERNLAPFSERVKLSSKAVWRSDLQATSLSYTPDPHSHYQGLGQVGVGKGMFPVDSIGLDSILAELPKVRLLKIDCDGCEHAVVLTSKLLHKVKTICMEYEIIEPVPETKGLPDYNRLDGEMLKHYLEKQGFETQIYPVSHEIGFIFAENTEFGRLES